ncbi:DUF3365 domain-containing protein [uncultured Ferrimonas sp.]|uniref:Tll0287-like domain-containing protein n=1 Tax=uncultured Ferrimonas sp. TaxID=432640 RepID=UPI00260E0655|nr:DUF3365 domain-containing protein [uncultured Ferrimonas sp.]
MDLTASLTAAALLVATPVAATAASKTAQETAPETKTVATLSATGQQQLEQQAQQLIKQFAGQLKPKLKQALQAGSPTQAISVCAQSAPQIAAQLSRDSGWLVRRISHKPRNPLATPDDWEQQQLQQFEQRLLAGEQATSVTASTLQQQHFRYLQAQSVAPMCLPCHGNHIAAPVRTAVAQHYPNDLATGYQLGQLRGAFSLSKPLLAED